MKTDPSPVIKSLTVHCDIKNEDQGKPGSFKVPVGQRRQAIYERSGRGLEEGWDDDTAHSTAKRRLVISAPRSRRDGHLPDRRELNRQDAPDVAREPLLARPAEFGGAEPGGELSHGRARVTATTHLTP